MAPHIRELAARPDDLSSVSEPYMVEGVRASGTYLLTYTQAHTSCNKRACENVFMKIRSSLVCMVRDPQRHT